MTTKNPTYAKREASRDEIDLIAVIDMLWRSRQWIAKTAGSIFAFGLLYAWLATPVYESSLLVQIESNSDDAGTQLLGNLSSLLGVKSSDDAEIEILRSRKVIGGAVDQTRYNILAVPARFPLIGRWVADGRTTLSDPGLFGFGGYAWGNESMVVAQFQTPQELFDEKFTVTVLDDDRYRLHAADLHHDYVGRVGETAHIESDAGEVTLNIKSIHAKPGTRFKLYRHSRQLTISELQQQIGIVDKAKDAGILYVSLQSQYPHRVTAFIQALGEAYLRQNSEQKSEEAQKSLDFLEQQLPGMKRDLHAAEDALLAYRNRHGAIDLGEQAKLDLGQVVALQTRVSLLEQDRQAKLEQFMPKHPDVVAMDAQIRLLQQQIRDMDAQIKRLPNTEQDVVRLTRDVRVNNDLYVAMLNSMQQLRLLRAGKVGNVRIVDHAELPQQPIKPRRALIVGGSWLLGLLFGIGTALLRHLWRGSVTDPHELEQQIGVPVQATIPLSKGQVRHDRLNLRRMRTPGMSRTPVAISQPQEPAVEGLRSLSVAVQLRGLEARNAIVLITSPTQGVGKSFVSVNLGVLLAKAGKRVLLIDGDLRKGLLQRAFQVKEAKGLVAVLRGEATLAEAVQPTGVAGLTLLPTGARVDHPAELLQTAALNKCLDQAAANYDIVLIDTAPLLPVADTMWLARLAGTIYVVARYGITSEGELIETRARLERAEVECHGIVLNGVQASLQGTRYGQYGYGNYASDPIDHDKERKGKHA